MKKHLLNPAKTAVFIMAFLMVRVIASATTYTAVTSGNWSSIVTWGGSAPPFKLTAGDQVNIGAGITVTMDSNVTLNGLLSEINVTGTLSAAPHIVLDVVSGTLAGSGIITAAQVLLKATGSFTFSGSLTADTVMNAITGLGSNAQIMVNDQLTLSGLLNVSTGGLLQVGPNSNITISGANIQLTGGTLNLSANYNVNYVNASIATGMELSGAGLGNVSINVGSGNNVTLSSNLVMNGSLNFASGTLMLDGYNLTANAQISGNIMVAGNPSSNLTVNTPGGLSASITFTPGNQDLNNVTINVGSGNYVKVSSGLNVEGTLMLSGGSELDVSGEHLTIDGDVNGSGSIAVTGTSDVDFETNNSITGNISITGSSLGKFNANIGTGDKVTLATNLTVDTLSLESGMLVLNGNSLSVNADITAGGNGMIFSRPSSNITVGASASVAGALTFDVSGDTVNNLIVNIGSGGSLKLGSNLVVNGTLSFSNGYFDIQNNNLNIGIAGSITGAGANSYVVTSGSGYLTMFTSVNNHTVFQVGTESNYFPADIILNPGSAVGTIGVNVSAGVYSKGNTGVLISASQPMVDATWTFLDNVGSGLNANMKLSWEASTEVNGFAHIDDYISHYVSAWDDIGDSMSAVLSGGLYSVTRANIMSMSPFAVFDQATIPTGINTIAANNGEFQVYPNPATQNLYIKNVNASTGITYAEIYNTLGQVVSRFQFNGSVFAVPVSELTVGNYFLRLYNDNMSDVKRFTKL